MWCPVIRGYVLAHNNMQYATCAAGSHTQSTSYYTNLLHEKLLLNPGYSLAHLLRLNQQLCFETAKRK